MKARKFYNKEISGTLPWKGRIHVEQNLQYDFSELTLANLDGFNVVGINFYFGGDGDIISGRLHLKSVGGEKKRKVYRKLKENISLEKIFAHFHIAEITVSGDTLVRSGK